jgi:hypothetical protein
MPTDININATEIKFTDFEKKDENKPIEVDVGIEACLHPGICIFLYILTNLSISVLVCPVNSHI